jgi:hypothetical protein
MRTCSEPSTNRSIHLRRGVPNLAENTLPSLSLFSLSLPLSLSLSLFLSLSLSLSLFLSLSLSSLFRTPWGLKWNERLYVDCEREIWDFAPSLSNQPTYHEMLMEERGGMWKERKTDTDAIIGCFAEMGIRKRWERYSEKDFRSIDLQHKSLTECCFASGRHANANFAGQKSIKL